MYSITVRSVEYVEAVMLHVSLHEMDETGASHVLGTVVRVCDQDLGPAYTQPLPVFLERTLRALVKCTSTLQTRLDQ